MSERVPGPDRRGRGGSSPQLAATAMKRPAAATERPAALAALACAGAALLAAGCSFIPPDVRPEPPVAAAFPVDGVYGPPDAAADDAMPRVEAAELGWRDFLRDARLQRLVELALANNRDLRAAVLNIESARAQLAATRAGLFPVVGANLNGSAVNAGSAIPRGTPGTVGVYQANLLASWQPDFFGRVRSLERAAAERYFAAAQSRKAAQLSLVAAVAEQYLAVLGGDEALAVTRSALAIAEESFRITRLRFDNGAGSELDVRQSQGALEQARAQLAAQQRARAQAENALVLLVGQPLPADLPAGPALVDQSLLADIPAGLPSDLLVRRPDIVAAENQLRAANANIGAARAAFFPTVTLTGLLGTVSPTLAGLFGAGRSLASLATGTALPLFNGGLNAANLEQARVQRELAVAQYERAIQLAFRSVADDLAARTTYADQVSALERLVGSQRRRLDLAQLRFSNGADSYLAVLIAQVDLNNARLSSVSARLARQIGRAHV